MTNAPPLGPGRPRDSAATAAILRAAIELAGERGGDAVTVEGIAARAGVGKTTIYRRWPNVWAIVMDAFLAEMTRLAPIEDRSTVRASLAASLRLLARAYRGRYGQLIRLLVGRAQVEPDLLAAVKVRWIEPRRQFARTLIRRGIESGELRRNVDPDILLDALYGPLYHRLLVPYENAPLSDAYIKKLVDAVFPAFEKLPAR